MVKVRIERLKKQKNQQEMANLLGVTQQAYAAYETGRSTPPLDTLIKMAEYFDVSLDYLVGRTDDPAIKEAEKRNANIVTIVDRKSRLRQFEVTDEETEMIVVIIHAFEEIRAKKVE